MATMLAKFRIEYSSMIVVQDIGKKSSKEDYDKFKVLKKFSFIIVRYSSSYHLYSSTICYIALLYT